MAVSLFVLKKQKLDNRSSNPKQLALLFKKEAQNQLIFRHPSFLKVLEPVYEDTRQIVFVTEKIQTTLYELFKEKNESFFKDEIFLKTNLKNLLKGLDFLNGDLKKLHCNICPENVFVNENGEWKIGGLMFLKDLVYNPEDSKKTDYTGNNEINGLIRPNYIFSSLGHPQSLSVSSDLFSFILLLHGIFSVLEKKKPSLPERISSIKEAQAYIEQITGIQKKYILEVFPAELVSIAGNALNRSGPSLVHSDFKTNSWFVDIRLRLLDFFQIFLTKKKENKIGFLVLLGKYMDRYSKEIVTSIILPFLSQHVNSPDVEPYILGLLLLIAEKEMLSSEETQ